jgi:radical SAM protein with 4Fe4S-binding SPASM domain
MSCDGTVYPCVLHAGNARLALGHISDPQAGWFLKGKEWVRAQEERDACKKCWALPLCGGGCPAMLSICGEDECEYTRKVCELAMAIYGSVPHTPDLLVLAGID